MPSIKDATGYLSLSDAIANLKAELIEANNRALAEDSAMLIFKECEIELALEFVPKLGAEFNIGVFKIATGAEAKGSHKVTVKYEADQILVAAARGAGKRPSTLEPAKLTADRGTSK